MALTEYCGDLHIHIGRTRDGRPVKVTAARSQTLPQVFREAVKVKGLDLVGIVDAACPAVCRELEMMVDEGEIEELPSGGLRYHHQLTVIPGVEMEATEDNGGRAHWLGYFPTLEQLRSFSKFLGGHLTNPELSTQSCGLPARTLLREVTAREGIFLPAHAFTPHKGVYGQVSRRLQDVLGADLEKVMALELGLSADTDLADRLGETSGLTFLSNSDAHSLGKLGREFNLFLMEQPDWTDLVSALKRRGGRRVAANYGLDPRLGKYHRTFCLSCQQVAGGEPPILSCPSCGSVHVIRGVLDRIAQIADWPEPRHPEHRPVYRYQIPMAFLPGIGPKTAGRLLEAFGNEFRVLHRAEPAELTRAAGERVAEVIIAAREGLLQVSAGGGGYYGRVKRNGNRD